jgi:FkbM family methyltransferase
VDPSELTGFYLYYEQEYDDHIFDFLAGRLPSFDIAIDIGANIGVYTTFMARYCMRVEAFEPDGSIVAKLQQNLQLNGVSNVTIHAKCVSDVTGLVHFETAPSANSGVGKIAERGISLPSINLGEFLTNLERRSLFIKMDIEGAEWLAIKGAKNVLRSWRNPLSLLIELHPEEIRRLGGSVSEVRRLLEEIGLTVWSVDSRDLSPGNDHSRFWWATNAVAVRQLI